MTDYFNMMRDVVGSYGKGIDIGRERQFQDEKMARAKVIQGREDTEYGQKQDAYTRTMGLQKTQDEALKSQRELATGGAYAVPEPHPDRPVMEGLGPMGVSPRARRTATDRDFLNSDMNVAAAFGDQAGIRSARGSLKKLDIGDTAKENIKRAAEDPEFMKTMVGQLNLNHGRTTIDNGIGADGKRARAPTISYVKDDGGVHSISPTPSQMKTVALAMSHIHHDDYEGGLQLLSGVDKTLAELAAKELGIQHQNFDSNTKSSSEYDKYLYQQGLLKNDTAKLGVMQAAENGRNARAQADDWKIVGTSKDNKGLLQFNSNTGASRVMGLPEGTDASGLFRKLTGGVNQEKYAATYKEFVGAGMPAAQAQMETDRLFGTTPDTSGLAQRLKEINDAKSKDPALSTASAPSIFGPRGTPEERRAKLKSQFEAVLPDVSDAGRQFGNLYDVIRNNKRGD